MTATLTDGAVADGALAVTGVVSHGDQRGRELGFPTANLLLADDAPVEDGVWAAEVRVGAERYVAAVSLGRRPTFYAAGGVRLLEAHLLDFAGDLYDQRMTVTLHELLRPQRRFGSMAALMRQMRRDVEGVRQWARGAAIAA